VPVEDYLSRQRRFAHLFGANPRPDIVAHLQSMAEENITRYGLLEPEMERSS
jgi:pyruvate ferredoxin oxidoreductase beta subunit